MKVNHSYFRDLGKLIADEIRNRLSKRNPVLDGAVIKYIREICRKTVQDLKVILGELEEFKRKVAPISQAERKNPVFFFTLLCAFFLILIKFVPMRILLWPRK